MAGRLRHVHLLALGRYHTASFYKNNFLRTCCATKLLPDLNQERKVHINAFSKTQVDDVLPFKGITHHHNKTYHRTPTTSMLSSMNLLMNTQARGLHLTSGLLFPSQSEYLTDSIPADTSLPSFDQVVDSAPDIVANSVALVEPTFSSLGLGGWGLTGGIQNFLEFAHINLGLPWWGAIVFGTLALRSLILPLMIRAQVDGGKMAVIQPEMMKIRDKQIMAMNMQDNRKMAEAAKDLKELYAKYNYNPFRAILVPFIQIPLFVSIFFGLREMAALPVESLKTGGILWFTDLTVTDPFFILPIATAMSTLIMFETSTEMEPMRKSMPGMIWVMRAMALSVIPYGIYQPSALLIYITTTTLISNIQAYVFRRPAVKQYFGIPTAQKPVKMEFGGFMDDFKKGFESAKQRIEQEQADMEKAKKTKKMLDTKQKGSIESRTTSHRVRQNEELFRKAKEKRKM